MVIVGRPNVGKSTLFNRLTGRHQALVDNTPGVTRDRRIGNAHLGNISFTAIDTAGLTEAPPTSLSGRMRRLTDLAVESADVILFLVDGRVGITPEDKHFASILRRRGIPIILIVNKCESSAGDVGLSDAVVLGLGKPVAISAEHAIGLEALHDALIDYTQNDSNLDCDNADTLKLAIVGRPNVGKSTLVNRLIGEQWILTGKEPCLTRDPISLPWSDGKWHLTLVDTAGLRRPPKVTTHIARMAVSATLETIRMAESVVLVIDSNVALERQDLVIARMVIREGRSLVVAANKWDIVVDGNVALTLIRDRLIRALSQAKDVSVVKLSALTGWGVDALVPVVIENAVLWNMRVSTSDLNRWLRTAIAEHPPPLFVGRKPKIRYITQIKGRPPTFVLFLNRPDALSAAYKRYLINRLREKFRMPGVPLRLVLRKGKNPYARR